jgi:iron(III) transport system ATP-binding protein
MLRHEIKELQRKLGVTTIMVTHDQEEALTMADRIVVMNNGRVEQVGSPQEIYHQPATRFVADFIGTMNFLEATSRGQDSIAIGQQEFRCDASSTTPGSRIVASIRPEDIVVREQGDNLIDAKIDEVEFLGAFVRARLSCAEMGDSSMLADFSANLVREEQIAEGMTISVDMPRESIRIYPA